MSDMTPMSPGQVADMLEHPERLTSVHLVALNFRVPFEVRQRMKSEAALHGVSMTQYLMETLQQRFASHRETNIKI